MLSTCVILHKGVDLTVHQGIKSQGKRMARLHTAPEHLAPRSDPPSVPRCGQFPLHRHRRLAPPCPTAVQRVYVRHPVGRRDEVGRRHPVMAAKLLGGFQRPYLDHAAASGSSTAEGRGSALRSGGKGCHTLVYVAVQTHDLCGSAAVSSGKPCRRFGHAPVVKHSGQFDVGTPGIGWHRAEEAGRIDIVYPHSAAGRPPFIRYSLYGHAADQEFLQRPGVDFGQRVALGCGFVDAVAVGLLTDESAYDGAHKFSYEVVGQRCAPFARCQFQLRHDPSCVVGHRIAPLVAEGEALVSLAAGAQCSAATEALPGCCQYVLACFKRLHDRLRCLVVIRRKYKSRVRGRLPP